MPKLPADVLDVARLRPAVLAVSRSVEPCELKLLRFGLRLPAVPGLSAPGAAGSDRACCLPLFGSGDGAAAPILSSESLLKIAINGSCLGKMTVSRNVMRVMRRTSSSSPCVGILIVPPEEVGRSSDFQPSGIAPQNSSASRGLMYAPLPLNSRSNGRKTACKNGRMAP